MKDIQLEELEAITSVLIVRIMNKLKDTPEAERLFLEWLYYFTHSDQRYEEAFIKLRPHVNWPA